MRAELGSVREVGQPVSPTRADEFLEAVSDVVEDAGLLVGPRLLSHETNVAAG